MTKNKQKISTNQLKLLKLLKLKLILYNKIKINRKLKLKIIRISLKVLKKK